MYRVFVESSRPSSHVSLSALALAISSTPALSQEASVEDEAPPSGEEPPPEAVEAVTPGRGTRQVYTSADFARYAPKNAYDMLSQVPGFSIRESDQLRGLGQATGNVIFNGRRSSSKSDSLFTQLTRIPADNVERIEIVDGASLDLPGLSGQVANIVFRADEMNGQFAWQPQFRAHFTNPLYSRGLLSVSGRKGPIEYEVSLDNSNASRSGAGGPTTIFGADGSTIETRDDVWLSDYDSPTASAKLTWDAPGSSIAHLNGQYQRTYSHYFEEGDRITVDFPDSLRIVRESNDTWNYELGGDYEFALGPGRMKAIGLRRYSHEPYSQEVITEFADASPSAGDRFAQVGDLSETIGRGEYNWKMLGGDWQWSAEAAFNSLDNVASLFALDPVTGELVEVDFPGGTAGVKEDRYESLLSWSDTITGNLSFQLVGGAEHSTITQTGANGLTRSFFRPKGFLSLAWKPSDDLDISFKIQRRVLQLSFYDFLARAFLDDGNENSGNNDLRPRQDWSFESEISKSLGRWGSTKVLLVYRDIEDFVDIVPVGNGESIGNIPKSKAAAVQWTSTINFDPAGIAGMKLDSMVLLQKSELRDPFTGETRQFSGFTDTAIDLNLRHDIPETDWAWGSGLSYNHNQPRYRSNQVDRVWEGPIWLSLFVENKDVMGMTARASVSNILNARSRRERVVYEGLRDVTPLLFLESRDRLIGPIFSFSLKGNF